MCIYIWNTEKRNRYINVIITKLFSNGTVRGVSLMVVLSRTKIRHKENLDFHQPESKTDLADD